MISMLSLFECITRFSSLSMEEIKLFAIVNWIFHESDFLRLFMMPIKYDLILLKYCSSESILFLSPLHLYFPLFLYCYSKNYLLFLLLTTYYYWFVIICFFFMLKKFLISLSILSLIALVSFSSLKRFLICLIVFFFKT